jgi:glyoxylase-like metal-dependent hydrolase (beta-lactamase superfamily II)
MTTEVLPNIHQIPIPLPRNPLRAVNTYLIRGEGRWLLVDTGMNRPECREAMRAALDALSVDLGRMDIFVTHGHADHTGQVSELATEHSRTYLSSKDASIALDPELWAKLAATARRYGFPEAETAVERHPGKKYVFSGRPQFRHVSQGDRVDIGPYEFQCVETPGHTPGHTCLYEPNAKILVSGDHLLDTITPNISGWEDETDALGDFLASLDKIAAYDITTVLPAHRNIMTDPVRRIEELKAHHAHRLAEALDILSAGPLTAYQVASKMKWDLDCANWESFPVPQKWFATGEALAHLRHLERTARIRKVWREDRYCFEK